MFSRATFGLCIPLAFLFAAGPASAAGWTVVDLGVGDGCTDVGMTFNSPWGAAINNLGNLAFTLGNEADYEAGQAPYPASYFYNKSAKATVALGDLGGGETEVFGINDSNIVVGQSYATPISPFYDAMAWKWNGSTGGTMIDLCSALGVASGSGSSNWGINNLDQVTGGVAYSGNGGRTTPYALDITHAFAATPSTTIKWLMFPGGNGGDGISINEHGCVVTQGADTPPLTNGYYDDGSPSAASSYAKPMPVPPGDTTSGSCNTRAINDAGYVLCSAAWGSGSAYPVSWVLDTTPGSNTVTYDRDVPPIVAGGTDVAVGLNNNAAPRVVGYASTSSGAQHAFIWTYGAAAATDLNTYAASLDAANLTGWVFTEADSVNNNGEIVGYGLLNGVSHCFALLNYSGPGDANGDGRVDVNDLTIVLSNFGKTGVGWMQGCMDGDPTGTVDVNDLTIVLSNFGQSYGSSAVGTAAVPEPGSLALVGALLFAMVLGIARRRK